MTIQYQVGVDWDGDGVIRWNASLSDPVNLFGLAAARMGSGRLYTYSSVANAFSENTADGALKITLPTVGNTALVGTDGGTKSNTGKVPSGVYRLRVDVSIASGTQWQFTLSNGARSVTDVWSVTAGGIFERSITLPLADTLYLKVEKTANGTSDQWLILRRMMIVSGDTLPTEFNAGAATLYENVTAWALEADWFLGFREPYQAVAETERLNVTLDNGGRLWSPENSASPVAHAIKPRRLVQVRGSANGGTPVVMWTGWLERVLPETVSSKAAKLTAIGSRALLDQKELLIELQVNKTPRQVIGAILEKLDVGSNMRGVYNGGNVPRYVPYPFPEPQLPYAPDNFEDKEDAVKLIEEAAGVFGAMVYFNRLGNADFLYRGMLNKPSTIQRSFEDSFIEAEYAYGDALYNRVTAKWRRRKLSASTTLILWDAEETYTLDPNETRNIRANYKDDNVEDRKVGAVNPYLEITKDAGVNHTVDFDAQSAEITLINTTASTKTVSVLRVRGQKITTWNEAEYTAEDAASIAEYGEGNLRLDYKLMPTRILAKTLADYWLGRLSKARGEMVSITIAPKQDTMDDAMLQTSFGTCVYVRDNQTNHAGVYVVIGESHKAAQGLASQQATYTLERVKSQPVTVGGVLARVGCCEVGTVGATNYL